jgi:tRNA U34 5-methylaminomethyl-2-thiouridine-forming methyltransferase MnmC
VPPPERLKTPTPVAGLAWLRTDDGSLTLWNERLNETYHSGCGAVAESLHVYLHNSGVAERLQNGLETSVFEVGFGTGTNFWLTAAWAERFGASLRYEAVDHWLPPAAIFEHMRLDGRVESADEALLTAAQGWLEAWRSGRPGLEWVGVADALPNCDLTCFEWRRDNISLHLNIACLENWQREWTDEAVDAIYFDAFSPQSSPELWTEAIYSKLFGHLKPGGRLVTYCVKRSVREGLRRVGFEIRTRPGPPGGKREVLEAIKP